MNYIFILSVLILILILYILFKNKIKETFINNIPNTPSDYSCFNYLSKYKKNWNLNELTSDQKKVLLTLKAGLIDSYDENSLEFPYTNSCIIPQNHYEIFNLNVNSITGTDINVDPSFKPKQSKYSLMLTSNKDYPYGVKINLDDDKMTFDNFKDILNGLYQQFDKEFLQQKKELLSVIDGLDKEYDELVVNYTNVINDTNKIQSNINSLNDNNSTCKKSKNNLPGIKNIKNIYDTYKSYIDKKIADIDQKNIELQNKEVEIKQKCI